ncbi:MAG: 50S ribosomal protein L25/general stress protein Ctc [Gammaproteobacteria bacterium]
MSDTIQLEVQERTDTGTAASRRLRKEHRVPAIIYGKKSEPQAVSISLFELERNLRKEQFYTSVLELKIGTKTERAVLKKLDQNPVRNEPAHLDFMRVTANTIVNMSIPLQFINEEQCVGVRTEGGVPTYQTTQITISAKASAIPERLEIDMTDVRVGQPVLLSDLKLPTGVSIPALDKGQDMTLALILPPRISKDTDLQADGGAPDAAEQGSTADENTS